MKKAEGDSSPPPFFEEKILKSISEGF